jgi:tetratricopeptide (TPR) repeat protein
MTNTYVGLHKWYQQLQQRCAGSEIIDEIRNRMRVESDPEALRSLEFILADEFRQQERYREAEGVLLDISERSPAEPYPLIALAEQKLYYEGRLEEALEIVEKALERARASGTFRRNALGMKARIAEKLRRYDLISGILREILTMKGSVRLVDVGVERDFVDRLPAGVIEAELLQEYDEFCRRGAS